MSTILLINDEARMLDLLSLYLIPYPHNCIRAASCKEGLSYLKKENVNLVILDVKMQELDGWVACQKIREFSEVPIIMLTERNETVEVIKGLKFGADDYITKPFQAEELLGRIEVLLSRLTQNDPNFFLNGLTWDQEAMELKYRNQTIILTPKEFALVGLFLKNPQKVLSRQHLLSAIWGVKKNERTIDSHVRYIRVKLRKSGFPIDQHLLTVWGVGYKWVATSELIEKKNIEKANLNALQY